MFDELRESRVNRLGMGLVFGIIFGFLLQKGGVTDYDVLLGQLLLTDFTVVKVMAAAVITGMAGIEILRSAGLVTLHPKTGSFGSTIPGGLIFGVGFALLGYCPGTMAGAVGEGRLDALLGGVTGVLIGSWLYAVSYPALERSVLQKGDFGELTFPALFRTKPRTIVVPVAVGLIVALALLERGGM